MSEVELSDGRKFTIKTLEFGDILDTAKFKDDLAKINVELIKRSVEPSLAEEDIRKLKPEDGLKLFAKVAEINPIFKMPTDFLSSALSEASGG
jgi:hypothetical protein